MEERVNDSGVSFVLDFFWGKRASENGSDKTHQQAMRATRPSHRLATTVGMASHVQENVQAKTLSDSSHDFLECIVPSHSNIILIDNLRGGWATQFKSICQTGSISVSTADNRAFFENTTYKHVIIAFQKCQRWF